MCLCIYLDGRNHVCIGWVRFGLGCMMAGSGEEYDQANRLLSCGDSILT